MTIYQGILIWQKEYQNYFTVSEDENLRIPFEAIRLSEVREEYRSIILHAIWARRNGTVNQAIGLSESCNQKIAENLGVW